MQLRRIEVRDFRKITHRIIDGLDDGLNVVVGDNEAGKSTLLAALRAVFFEKHSVTGEATEAMMPYGSSVRPEIQVDFELDGQAWRLRKAFNQRKEAELTGPHERLTGGAVEDRLSTWLGFTAPSRGQSAPDRHQGTHGLLWVEQGTRKDLGVGAGRDTLAAALEREVGQVTGGDRGRILLAAAAERRDRFWTKTDKPRGEFKELRDELDRLEGEQAALQAKRQVVEARIARLGDVADILARYQRENRIGRATKSARGARAARAAASALAETLRQATTTRANMERERTAAQEKRSRRAALVAELAKARAQAEAAADQAREADMMVSHHDGRLRASEARLVDARRQREAQEASLAALDEALRRRQAEGALAQLERQFSLASGQDEARRQALARAASHAITPDALVRLVKLEKDAETARVELRAAAVQISFEPEPGRMVVVEGAAHDPTSPLTLSRDGVLDLEGFGRLIVRPGGGTASLARRADTAEEALREALARAGVDSVAEARLALERSTGAVSEAESLGKSVTALAPRGLDALRQQFDSARASLARPPTEAVATLMDSAEPRQLEEARELLQTRRREAEIAEHDARFVTQARQDALLEAARAAERRNAARARQESFSAELVRARAEADDDLLEARLLAAEQGVATALEAEAAAQSALEAADPESAELTLERAERAEREIRSDAEALDRERRDIEAELRGGGQDGLDERLAEIDGLLSRERKRLAAMALEADAARLLHDELIDAQRDAKDRWLAPVRARVSPYLRLLSPGSDVEVDEHTLELKGLARNGVVEPFAALSMGAREQIAVVTRLALADVLRDAGHPAVVILDDALVNTDEGRLERMHNVLTRAARGLQIVVLTCRERDFLGLGKVHRM